MGRLFLAGILCLIAAPGRAETRLELKWEELDKVVSRQKIRIQIPGGPRVEGEALVVRPEALVMNVRGTSDKNAYPKGQREIPRASVKLIEMQERRGIMGRAVGTTIGAVGGIAAGIGAGSQAKDPGPAVAIWAVVTSVCVFAGYQIGAAADRRNTVITITP